MTPLVLVGASTRAAAFSALRADMLPICVDLYADTDLQARCRVRRIPPHLYPHGLPQVIEELPTVPWMYTGGLENHPDLVAEMAGIRSLWGNDRSVLAKVRSPWAVAEVLRAAKVPCPAVRHLEQQQTLEGRWLVKPFASAGGRGIHFLSDDLSTSQPTRPVYLQKYVEGDCLSAVYLGDGRQCWLLGITQQLVGEPWLHVAPFHYCGSIGPVNVDLPLRQAIEKLGCVLVENFCLRGLFGVDLVVADRAPWPIEINPRYTASVEVLEYASHASLLALHCRVFEQPAMAVTDPPTPVARQAAGRVGKAILFSRTPLIFPDDGPWIRSLRQADPVGALPAFADIPLQGERIDAGRPILTVLTRAETEAGCLLQLQDIASDLDRWLYRT